VFHKNSAWGQQEEILQRLNEKPDFHPGVSPEQVSEVVKDRAMREVSLNELENWYQRLNDLWLEASEGIDLSREIKALRDDIYRHLKG
jgi:hypothetical protein